MGVTFISQTIIVAGGTGALGGVITEAFVREGAHVITTFRHATDFESLSAAVGEHVDVTDELALAGIFAAALARHASLDVLVNAVGGYLGGAKLWEMPAVHLDQMLAMAGSLAAELEKTPIRVNSILPRVIDTPADRRSLPDADVGRWASPTNIAQLILFLCSDQGATVRGAAIPVQGTERSILGPHACDA